MADAFTALEHESFGRRVNYRKYLVLSGVAIFAAAGDAMLSEGMKQSGGISLRHLPSLIAALLHPSVAIGIVLLIGFFATYTNALSWADLTYVLPASSLGYVLLALIAKFVLHEHISVSRWLGIALISVGVGFVAAGPSATSRPEDDSRSVGGTSLSAADEYRSPASGGAKR